MERSGPVLPPRLLGALDAAFYCGVGETLFKRECPARPIRIGGRLVWDKRDLDAWINELGGRTRDPVADIHELIDAINARKKALDREADERTEAAIRRLTFRPKKVSARRRR